MYLTKKLQPLLFCVGFILSITVRAESVMVVKLKQQITENATKLKQLQDSTIEQEKPIVNEMRSLVEAFDSVETKKEQEQISTQYFEARTKLLAVHAKMVTEGIAIIDNLREKVMRLDEEYKKANKKTGIDFDNKEDRKLLKESLEGFNNGIVVLMKNFKKDSSDYKMLDNTFVTMSESLKDFYTEKGVKSLQELVEHLQNTSSYLTALKRFLSVQNRGVKLSLYEKIRNGIIDSINSSTSIGGNLVNSYADFRNWDAKMTGHKSNLSTKSIRREEYSPAKGWLDN